MGFMYRADADEAEVLRRVFGPTVASVVFYDAEEGGFETAQGFDTDDNELPPRVEAAGSRWWDELAGIMAGRGETVKFWLTVPESPARELERQVHRAVKAAGGDSNDEEIEALWWALELALARWPEVDRGKGWPL